MLRHGIAWHSHLLSTWKETNASSMLSEACPDRTLISVYGARRVQVLQRAGLPDAQLVHLTSQVFRLQCAFERMAVVKEYR